MNFFQWLAPPIFEAEAQTQQARRLYLFLLIGFGVEIVFAFNLPLLFPEYPEIAWIFLLGTVLLNLIAYVLMRREKLRNSSFLLCLGFSLLTLGTSFLGDGLNSFTLPLFTLVILMAGLLLGAPTGLAFAFLGIVGILALQTTIQMELISVPESTNSTFLIGLTLVSVYLFSALIFLVFFRNMNSALAKAEENSNILRKNIAEIEIEKNKYEERLQQQASQLERQFELDRTISRFIEPDQQGLEIVQKLTKLFPFEFAHIYLIDVTERWAILKFSSEAAPSIPYSEMQQIDLQQPNGISNAIRTRQTQVTTALSQSVHGTHPLPANIHTEVTVPLLSHRKTLGAINLQSQQTFSPSRQEMDILENFAGQLAIVMENASLLDETKRQLEEINRLNQFYLQTTWRALLTQDTHAFRYTANGLTQLEKPNESALQVAQHERKIQIINENGTSTLIAPIIFQGQVLGALELNAPNRTWTSDEIVMIEAVLNQTSLSLENTRLIFETRNRAEQEKMIGEISTRVRETLDLETILQTSVQELQQGLQLSEVEIRLLPPATKETGPIPTLAHGE